LKPEKGVKTVIQEIAPRIFDNGFKNRKAVPEDLFLAYQEDEVLVNGKKDKLWYPSFADFEESHPHLKAAAQFLFTVDDIHYFLVEEKGLDAVAGWNYVSTSRFRSEKKFWRSFPGAVGWQLNRWYENHGYCSRCREPMGRGIGERHLQCPSCGLRIYPTISPVVIVGVTHGDRLLLTKYAGRDYGGYALIAGFVEIGETLEEAVSREVMEEVGLEVRKIKYYKSQPWPFTDTLLAGFFAELAGKAVISLQEDELSQAVWVSREDVPDDEGGISLTAEMMATFKKSFHWR
jgi:NAD+ diphosphatase